MGRRDNFGHKRRDYTNRDRRDSTLWSSRQAALFPIIDFAWRTAPSAVCTFLETLPGTVRLRPGCRFPLVAIFFVRAFAINAPPWHECYRSVRRANVGSLPTLSRPTQGWRSFDIPLPFKPRIVHVAWRAVKAYLLELSAGGILQLLAPPAVTRNRSLSGYLMRSS